MELFEVQCELYIEDRLVQRQVLTAPKEFLMRHFYNIALQMKDSPQKMRFKMLCPELIWIPWDNKHKIIENSIEIQNYN